MAEPITEEDLIYRAWRDSEAYAVPVTMQGEHNANQRYAGFKKGWLYAKYHSKTNDVYMKDNGE